MTAADPDRTVRARRLLAVLGVDPAELLPPDAECRSRERARRQAVLLFEVVGGWPVSEHSIDVAEHRVVGRSGHGWGSWLALRRLTSAAKAVQSPELACCHCTATAMWIPSMWASIAAGSSEARENRAVERSCRGFRPIRWRTIAQRVVADGMAGAFA